MNDCVIKINTSFYKGLKIKDSDIMRHLGIDTYSTLQKLEPWLYSNFIECLKTPNTVDGIKYPYVRPKQLQVMIFNSGLSGIDIKKFIIADMISDDIEIPEIILKLKKSSKLPDKKLKIPLEETLTTFLFYLIMIILIVLSILIILRIIF